MKYDIRMCERESLTESFGNLFISGLRVKQRIWILHVPDLREICLRLARTYFIGNHGTFVISTLCRILTILDSKFSQESLSPD